LRNALKALHLFYKEKQANKAALFELYQDNGLLEDFSYTTKKIVRRSNISKNIATIILKNGKYL